MLASQLVLFVTGQHEESAQTVKVLDRCIVIRCGVQTQASNQHIAPPGSGPAKLQIDLLEIAVRAKRLSRKAVFGKRVVARGREIQAVELVGGQTKIRFATLEILVGDRLANLDIKIAGSAQITEARLPPARCAGQSTGPVRNRTT